ncbi:SDR family oxidoreductase [Massilia sp. GCM10020059]|uniref:SDR family oxidoreductase n=1 Tax=Massilia agrisoli TaxID=2892444 RepID=A0ABS8ISK3_9BURK|nr:SDR family oxidoreductase [Massilia agrisoli]MCC6071574.1 SDR family oxidoreductase [Massilia agrisoli]
MRPRYRAVITGAGGGIGAAIARQLAPLSDSLILVGRRAAPLQLLRAELKVPVQLVCGDLAEPGTLAAVEAAARQSGGLNLLVNNAGVSEFHSFETQSPEAIRSMVDTNLLAPMLLTRQLLPLLRQAPSAQVVNVGSIFGLLGFPGFAAYGASKSGLKGFSQALRRELSDTAVEVRHFAPRATSTGINSAAVNAMNDELNTAQDSPEAVAAAFVAFLGGDAWQKTLGGKESFFVLLNKLVPALPDGAIRKQLQVIRKHLPR